MRATTLHVIPSRLVYTGRHLSWTTVNRLRVLSLNVVRGAHES